VGLVRAGQRGPRACQRPRAAGRHLAPRPPHVRRAVAWETIDDEQAEIRDFADIWRAADKVVYSRTLEEPSSARTRIEREFAPEAVNRMKDESERDLSVGGPELAAQALRAGLVDEIQLFLSPIVVGGGNAALPDDVRVPLELLDERRFGNDVVYLQYRVTT